MISNYLLFENTTGVEIELKHDGLEKEQITKTIVEKTLSTYTIPWFAPKKIIIDASVIPFSSPIITINTRLRNSGDNAHLNMLELLVHENLHHWFAKKSSRDDAIKFFKGKYPDMGTDFINKKTLSKDSYWMHFPIIWNTIYILKKLLKKSELNYLFKKSWRPYASQNKLIQDNYKEIGEDLKKLNMIVDM